MAKTSAERTREMRERRKKEGELKASAIAPTIFRKQFSDYLATKGASGYGASEIALGRDWWDFTSDDGFKPFSGEGVDEEELRAASNSLGKAERLLDVLEDLLSTLTHDLNDYKRREIDARITEIEQADLSDPAAKKQAFADMARLKKMRDQLDKQVRWTFPQWKVMGE